MWFLQVISSKPVQLYINAYYLYIISVVGMFITKIWFTYNMDNNQPNNKFF